MTLLLSSKVWSARAWWPTRSILVRVTSVRKELVSTDHLEVARTGNHTLQAAFRRRTRFGEACFASRDHSCTPKRHQECVALFTERRTSGNAAAENGRQK